MQIVIFLLAFVGAYTIFRRLTHRRYRIWPLQTIDGVAALRLDKSWVRQPSTSDIGIEYTHMRNGTHMSIIAGPRMYEDAKVAMEQLLMLQRLSGIKVDDGFPIRAFKGLEGQGCFHHSVFGDHISSATVLVTANSVINVLTISRISSDGTTDEPVLALKRLILLRQRGGAS